MKTVLEEIIEKLLADSKYLNGENDSKIDRTVGQYLKTIADDLQENYLVKEKEQIMTAFYCGDLSKYEGNPNKYFDDNYKNID